MKVWVIGLALMVGMAVLGCKDGDKNCEQMGLAVPQPHTTCCDFDNRQDCQEFRDVVLDKAKFRQAHHICFECGKCLTDCPKEREYYEN